MVYRTDIKQQCVNALRILSAEEVSNANSGHTGICAGAAPATFLLYSEIMQYSPDFPLWENRDRFVLSAGHGSALLYALLHLFGNSLTKEDLASFRQLGSKTPGHPEYGVTAGVDCSTGPLGQGIASAVGMALAEAHLAKIFNREGFNVVDHYTFALCGEGCLEEGISYEACSFAGTQKLGKLILFYDCNKISIEGSTDKAFTDDIALRFKSQGWQTLEVGDANDLDGLRNAVAEAKTDTLRPSIIICRSRIGYGTPFEGTAKIHGTPLDKDGLARTKEFFNWNEAPFEAGEAVKTYCSICAKEAGKRKLLWDELFARYAGEYPDLAEKYRKYFYGEPELENLYEKLKCDKDEATRISGGIVINEIAKYLPNLLSGSADLSPSTKTDIVGGGRFSPENREGRNISFGIREHAMGAICNGIALHGGLRVICSTFLVFSDYMKGAMRMSAIMGLPVIYVLTHDSIGVGEDGPTHQPVEQLAMLRATPDIDVFRPSDRAETISAFVRALNSKKPSAVVLSRQNLKQKNVISDKGAYIISDRENPRAVLVASGSEVDVCLGAQKILMPEIPVRVVSVPCVEVFEAQSDEYKNKILPDGIPVMCVEASSDSVWYKYGRVLNMTSFGASGKAESLFARYGFTAENVANEVKKLAK